MLIETLCLFLRDGHVLLARKKRTFGVGFWNGYGGKVEQGETITQSLVREIRDESKAIVSETDLTPCAVVNVYHGSNGESHQVHVFTTRIWRGTPEETAEAGKPKWFRYDEVPYREMFVDDKYWVLLILCGLTFEAEVCLADDGKSVVEITIYPKVFL